MPIEENGEPVPGSDFVEPDEAPKGKGKKKLRAPHVRKAGVRVASPSGLVAEIDGKTLNIEPIMPLKVTGHPEGFDKIYVYPHEIPAFVNDRLYKVCDHAGVRRQMRDGVDSAKNGTHTQTTHQVLLCRPLEYRDKAREMKEAIVKKREQGVHQRFQGQAKSLLNERAARVGNDDLDLRIEKPKMSTPYIDVD